MADDQFPVLSFQDGLNLLQGDLGDSGSRSILEARNAAPFLPDYCISPTGAWKRPFWWFYSLHKWTPLIYWTHLVPKRLKSVLVVEERQVWLQTRRVMSEIHLNTYGAEASNTEQNEAKKHRKRKGNNDVGLPDLQVTPNVKKDSGIFRNSNAFFWYS